MAMESAPGGPADDAARAAAEGVAHQAVKAQEPADMEMKAEEAMRNPGLELNEDRKDVAFFERESSQDRERAISALVEMGLSLEDIRNSTFAYEWREDIQENVMVATIGDRSIRAWHEGSWGMDDSHYRATENGQELAESDAALRYTMLANLGRTQQRIAEGRRASEILEKAAGAGGR